MNAANGALLASALAAALTVACAAPPPTRPALDLAPFTTVDANAFPGAAAVLSGFGAPDDDPAMRVGDAALLGLELHRGGALERQLLLLEVVDLGWRVPDEVWIGGVLQPDGGGVRVRNSQQFTITESVGASGAPAEPGAQPAEVARTHTVFPVDVRLQRFDVAGRELRASVAALFEEPLAYGWWPYTQPRDARAQDHAFALTMSLQNLANDDPVLRELLFEVIDPPSLWSIATHFGVDIRLRIEPPPPDAAPIPVAGVADEVRAVAIELHVNGSPALWVTLLVAQPHAATRVCGGLVGAIAQHPTDPSRFAAVRLLATRRGAVAQRGAAPGRTTIASPSSTSPSSTSPGGARPSTRSATSLPAIVNAPRSAANAPRARSHMRPVR